MFVTQGGHLDHSAGVVHYAQSRNSLDQRMYSGLESLLARAAHFHEQVHGYGDALSGLREVWGANWHSQTGLPGGVKECVSVRQGLLGSD